MSDADSYATQTLSKQRGSPDPLPAAWREHPLRYSFSCWECVFQLIQGEHHVTKLVHRWFRQRIAACSAPSHRFSHWWYVVNCTMQSNVQWIPFLSRHQLVIWFSPSQMTLHKRTAQLSSFAFLWNIAAYTRMCASHDNQSLMVEYQSCGCKYSYFNWIITGICWIFMDMKMHGGQLIIHVLDSDCNYK